MWEAKIKDDGYILFSERDFKALRCPECSMGATERLLMFYSYNMEGGNSSTVE